MTTLTDPVRVEVPASTPVEPAAPIDPPQRPREPRIPRRRSARFTVRTSAAAHSYPSWERAIFTAAGFSSTTSSPFASNVEARTR